jgi:hypothetical protein
MLHEQIKNFPVTEEIPADYNIQQYFQPHQRQFTKILFFVVQTSPELIPPDIL